MSCLRAYQSCSHQARTAALSDTAEVEAPVVTVPQPGRWSTTFLIGTPQWRQRRPNAAAMCLMMATASAVWAAALVYLLTCCMRMLVKAAHRCVRRRRRRAPSCDNGTRDAKACANSNGGDAEDLEDRCAVDAPLLVADKSPVALSAYLKG